MGDRTKLDIYKCGASYVSTDLEFYQEKENIRFFYISDIHLDHHIKDNVKNPNDIEQIKEYIHSEVEKISKKFHRRWEQREFLIIAGDIASRFDIIKIFFEFLVKYIEPYNIIVISGNHELWDPYVEMEDNIAFYKKFYRKMKITYLYNELFYMDKKGEYNIISENVILDMSETELKEKAMYSPFLVLGGIGFNQYNEEYNATTLQYGKSFEGIKEIVLKRERQEAKKFDKIYKKIYSALSKYQVIVLTHMKKSNWNKDTYNSKWIYVYGHDHINFLEHNIYGNNQIGYKNDIELKYFELKGEYDIFLEYPDGIYRIEKEQYEDFYIGKILNMRFYKQKNKIDDIYMIKKEKYYIFFATKAEKIFCLRGGRIYKLSKNKIKDLQYYYDNLECYVDGVYNILQTYLKRQKKLSDFIKSLGGSGKIHGCIIDVDCGDNILLRSDSLCHLFVNPYDNSIVPYKAENKVIGEIYSDLKTMLEYNKSFCHSLYESYLRIGEFSECQLSEYSYFYPECVDSVVPYEKKGNWIYTVSDQIKMLQVEKNIIRHWNEKILEYVHREREIIDVSRILGGGTKYNNIL